MNSKPKLERFNENVLAKYQIYNGIFITLPFDEVSNTGALLPLFMEVCEKGYADENDPESIVEKFFTQYLEHYSEDEQLNLLFRFIQYIERQVVLFDAIEDASFPVVNNMDGRGTLRNLREEAKAKNKVNELREKIEDYAARIVLTAHPTQFYPGSVLGIINDLADAIRTDDLIKIKSLLAQLGKTPFFKQEKPSPLDEAVSLIWYAVALGFWPGGDRDGNPFVTTEITLQTAEKLRTAIIRNYFRDFRTLKRRLTFSGLEKPVKAIETMLSELVFDSENTKVTLSELKTALHNVKTVLSEKHQGLFLDELNDLRNYQMFSQATTLTCRRKNKMRFC